MRLRPRQTCDAEPATRGCAGDRDLLPQLLSQRGTLHFTRVLMKPGKPLTFATVPRRTGDAPKAPLLVFGLPGNPVSAFACFHLVVAPALRAMLGAPDPLPRAVPMPAGADLPPGGARGEFTRAVLREGRADPIRQRDSSLLAQLARADALIWRPPHCAGTKAGTDVPVYRLENGAIA